MAIYELAVLGNATTERAEALRVQIDIMLADFGLALGREVSWTIAPHSFTPSNLRASAVVLFCPALELDEGLKPLFWAAIPVIPVVSSLDAVSEEVPVCARGINCLPESAGIARIATLLLECIGLLSKQRRVFLSYRRSESRQAALQLFDALSERVFDVFLDTHGVPPAEEFQTVLWHRLCESDVLVMLDTPGYFDSRWTDAEFGRALAKQISIVQVCWPGHSPSDRAALARRVILEDGAVDFSSGRLGQEILKSICDTVEVERSKSQAVRFLNLTSKVRMAAKQIGGSVESIGPQRAISLKLGNGKQITAFPVIAVPTSTSMQEATEETAGGNVAIVYDEVGLHPRWSKHLKWLSENITAVRWLNSERVAWQLADWPE